MEKNGSTSTVLRGVLILIFGIILLFYVMGIMQHALNWVLGGLAIYLIYIGLVRSGLGESLKELWSKKIKPATKTVAKEIKESSKENKH